MTTTEKTEQAITNFVRGGDNSDTAMLDKILHKDFRATNNGFMGISGVTQNEETEMATKNNHSPTRPYDI